MQKSNLSKRRVPRRHYHSLWLSSHAQAISLDRCHAVRPREAAVSNPAKHRRVHADAGLARALATIRQRLGFESCSNPSGG
eukprot:3864335-Amphidinium_carterae.1